MTCTKKYGKGWYYESERHRLSRLGIKTGRKVNYATTFKETLEKVKREAEAPYKTQIMVHKMKRILIEKPPKTDIEREERRQRQKEEDKILSSGLGAVRSLAEIGHATSTSNRFNKWASEYGYKNRFFDVDRKSWNKGEPIDYEGELYYPFEEFKQTGYGAYHIGDAISRLKKQDRELLIVNSSRNRRFLYATKEKGKKINHSKVDVQSQIDKVRRAYADTDPNIPYAKGYKLRNLDFKGTDFIDVKDSLKVMKPIGSYNKFTPEKTYKKLEPFSNKLTVRVGREGSPVIYVKGSKETIRKVVKNFVGYADEIDIKNNTLRLWFD